MRRFRGLATKACLGVVRPFRRMTIAEPETTLASRITAALVVNDEARKIMRPAGRWRLSTTFQRLAPILNDLHELSTTYENPNRLAQQVHFCEIDDFIAVSTQHGLQHENSKALDLLVRDGWRHRKFLM
jgi:hypothetical protein